MALRIGIVTDGLVERSREGCVEIANGGVGVYIHSLVSHLRRLEPRHRYVLIRYGRGRLELYDEPEHVALPLDRSPLAAVSRLLDLPHLRAARDHGLDLLHYPNQFGGAFLPSSLPRVVTLHDLTPLLFPRHHPLVRVVGYRVLLPRALRAADHVIVDAEFTRAELLRRLELEPARVSAVHLGKGDHFHPVAPTAEFERRYRPPSRYILNVGVLEPRKNHRVLIEAFARVREAGEDVALVLVGREGWRWRDPLDEPSLSHLRPWVQVHRHVPDADMPEFYARAAAFAYPSLYEGFGLPLIEAMACGVPVVTSNTSCLPEVAAGAALHVAPRDAAGLATQLLRVLRRPELRRRLVEAGAARAAELSWQRTARQTLAIYEDVCARRRVGS